MSPTSPQSRLDKATKRRSYGCSTHDGDPQASPLLSAWVPRICGPSPPPPRGLMYSGKGMEVIHLGNCDCPFPGIGCACEVLAAFPSWPRPTSRPRRTVQPRGPAGSRWVPSLERGGRGRCGALTRSALHLPQPPGAPEVPGSPPPALFVTARLPVCRLPTPAHFPGGEAAEGREFLGDYPSHSAPPPAPPNPAPVLGAGRAAVKASGLCTRGRCEAIGAAHRWGPPAPPDLGSALLCPGAHGTSQGAAAGCEFSFFPCRAELPPGLESLSRVNSRTLFPKYTSGCPESPGPFTYPESSQQPALSPPPDFSSPGIPGLWHPE